MVVIEIRMDDLAPVGIISQFHDVVEITPFFILTNVQDVHESVVRPRNGFKLPDPRQFPLEGALMFKVFPINNLDRAIRAHQIAGQPHFPVTAPADTLD